jgi:hypothetical protein
MFQRNAFRPSKQSSACHLLLAGNWLGLIFSSEDGGNMFLPDIDVLLSGYMLSLPRRQYSSLKKIVCHLVVMNGEFRKMSEGMARHSSSYYLSIYPSLGKS